MDLKDHPAKFIVFEGADASGKSTQLKKLSEHLTRLGVDHVTTREPGGTPMAEDIRDLVLSPRPEPVSGKTEMLLMFASREQHLEQVIRPALAEGRWVLCDRFIETTYAYQVKGRGLEPAFFFDLTVNVVGDTAPDLTIFIDTSDEVCQQRRQARTDGKDRIDGEELAYHKLINDTLRELSTVPNHVAIDGEQDVDAVADATLEAMLAHFG